jgi:hypothetical protein
VFGINVFLAMRVFYEPVDNMVRAVMQFEEVPFDVPVQRIIQGETHMKALTLIATCSSPYAAARELGFDLARRLSPLGVTLQDPEGEERWRRDDETFILVAFYKSKKAVMKHANMVRVMYDVMRRSAHAPPVCESFHLFFSGAAMTKEGHNKVAADFVGAFVKNDDALARCSGTKLLFAFITRARSKGHNLSKYCERLRGKQAFGTLGRDGLYPIKTKIATEKSLEEVCRVYEAVLDYMQDMHQTHNVEYGSKMMPIKELADFDITTPEDVYKHFTNQWIREHRPQLSDDVHDIFEGELVGKGYSAHFYFPRAVVCLLFRETFDIPEDSNIKQYVLYKGKALEDRSVDLAIPPGKRARVDQDLY